MSGKTSIGEPVLVCPRKPKTATYALPSSRKTRKKPRSINLIFVDDRHLLAAALLQKLPGLEFGKARFARLDDEEKAVIRRAAEPPPVKDRVIPARQTV